MTDLPGGGTVSEQKHFTIINKRNRRVLKDLLPLAKPLSVFLEPTNRCNFKCVCCGHGNEGTRNDLKPLVHMEFALFQKIIGELRAWEGDRLRLLRLAVLGEPFMHPRMTEMIKLAKEADVAEVVDLFSNGSLMSEKISSEIVAYGLDSIRFSIYSVLKDRHKAVTQTTVDPDLIFRNIAKLREIRDRRGSATPRICVKMFESYGEENAVFRKMYEGVADEVDFENVNDATLYNGSNLVGAFYQDAELEQQTRKNFQASLNRHQVCPRPFMALVVCSNGAVLMCTHDYPRATKVGDLNVSTIREVWNSRALYEFRKMLLEGRKDENRLCKNCVWYKLFPDEDCVDGLPPELFLPAGGFSG